MHWLQPRALSHEEIKRLAKAQAYAIRVTMMSGGFSSVADAAKAAQENASASDNSVVTEEKVCIIR